MAEHLFTDAEYELLRRALLKGDATVFNFKASEVGYVNIYYREFYDVLDSASGSLPAQETEIFVDAVNIAGKSLKDTNNPEGNVFASRTAFFLMGITVDVFTKQGSTAQLSATDIATIKQNVITWFNFRTNRYFDMPLAAYPSAEDPSDFRRRLWLGVSSLWIPALARRSQTILVRDAITLTAGATARIRIGWHGYYARPVG
jgi:hypothetical protein